MSLLALDQISGEEYLEEFYDKYSARLENASIDTKWEVDDWWSIKRLIKENRGYGHDYVFFLQKMTNEWVDEVITELLSEVLPSIASAAYHCLIRLAYAIEWGMQNEIAASLAHFVFRYDDLGESEKVSWENIDTLYEEIRKIRITDLAIHNSISTRLKEISTREESRLCRSVPKDISLENISQLAARIYSESDDDFTCLHLVTSCHALRIVFPYITDKQSALEYYYISMMFAVISVQWKLVWDNNSILKSTYSFTELLEIAKKSPNDHTIKLAYTCVEEDKIYGRKIYKDLLEYRLQKEWILDTI